MIRTGHVINQNQVVNSSIHQQLGVPVVTMMSGLTAISQPQIHTAANMPQPNTQVSSVIRSTPQRICHSQILRSVALSDPHHSQYATAKYSGQ